MLLNQQVRGAGDVQIGWWHALLDHLVGTLQQARRQCQAKAARGPQVYGRLETRPSAKRQLTRLERHR
jgi:hypothetical protein